MAVVLGVSGCEIAFERASSQASTQERSDEPIKSLLDRWQATTPDKGLPKYVDDRAIGQELWTRVPSGQMTAAESQQFFDIIYAHDRHGARTQLARTPKLWPVGGNAWVRAVAIYPASTTELHWRRAGDADWHRVEHYGSYAFLDLGAAKAGDQCVALEYKLIRDETLLWQGVIDATYDGYHGLDESCEIVRDPAVDAWLAKELFQDGNLAVRAPLAATNPGGIHVAIKMEFLRDGVVVARGHRVYGLGDVPKTCGWEFRAESIEWLVPDARADGDRAKWITRVTGVPELAATPEYDGGNPTLLPPRKVWGRRAGVSAARFEAMSVWGDEKKKSKAEALLLGPSKPSTRSR